MTGVLIESLRANDLFAGGLVLMLLGSLVTVVYRVLPIAVGFLVRRFTVRLEIRNQEVFGWFGDWLGQQRFSEGYRRLSVDLLHVSNDDHVAGTLILVFAPGRGVHIVRYNGQWFWVERTLEQTSFGGLARQQVEVFTVRTSGTDPDVLMALVRDAGKFHMEKRRGRIAVYCVDRHEGWHRIEVQEGRSLDSVVLHGGIKERIVADMEEFLGSSRWYAEMGVPYRRGYLIHGPPGCGKTTFARALATYFRMEAGRRQ